MAEERRLAVVEEEVVVREKGFRVDFALVVRTSPEALPSMGAERELGGRGGLPLLADHGSWPKPVSAGTLMWGRERVDRRGAASASTGPALPDTLTVAPRPNKRKSPEPP